VLVETGRRAIAGESLDAMLPDHRERFEKLFTALRDGIKAS